MTTKELYTKGARIWVEHPEKVWESATVTSDYRSGVLIAQIDQSGEIRQIKIKDESKLPPLRNPSLLIGQNDLTSLSYLHEPAVLHNLRVRFCDRNAIYTYCGIVLVAINPYYDLPIYGDETIMAYRGQAMGDLDPHIFAVSEEAYTKLERERRDQSIIVSGESGAGKTVSAKYAMRYFAAVGGNASETQVERKVLASSPIMEAIGNAKTTRNDNSSRFGKFIEIHFDNVYRISGASMRTYLLEKSRVVYQSAGERNYHVFYQLCAAAKQMPELQLDHQESFHYLNQGGSPNIDGVDDLKTFNETRSALVTLGVTESEQRDMFKILAAILHLGNVDLSCEPEESQAENEPDDGAYISSDDKHLSIVCSLLGISETELSRWLTHRRIASAHEVIVSRMDVQRATFARDALAKRMYGELFAWLVHAVNRALDTGCAKKHFIGVLDIYGFETFEINSFEQFCINYANEKLQQQFNSHVFKLEQDEYIKEEISWEMIEFYDNQPCIDLIEDRLGVLALLDEQCRVPGGSDAGFVAKLHQSCASYHHFMKPRFGNAAFIIKHFADNVEYQCGGFLEKNRDTVSEEQLECVKSSGTCRLIHVMFADRVSATSTLPPPSKRRTTPSVPLTSLTQPPRRASGQKQTVGSQFRASLSALMSTLSATTPHYVRCIKPNDTKEPFSFDSARAVNQLRACGVLETIRISAAGFPSRWLYQDFFFRYRLLCLYKEIDRGNIKATCGRILARHVKDNDKYQFGATKIFFRAGQVAYLEKIRADIQREYCVRVQSCVRRFIARRKYLRIMSALRALQARARGFLARRRAQEIRRKRAAIKIQRNVRGWLARLKYQRLRRLAIGLQAHARGYMARNLYRDRRKVKAVVTIQRYARGYLARKLAKRLRRQIVIAQATIRRFLARRQYKRLRIEARSLDHVKSLNKGLENKIISLQQRLGDAMEKNKQIEPLLAQIVDLNLDHAKSLNKGLENKIISLQQRLGDAMEKNKQIEPLLAQIVDLKAKLELLKLVEIEVKTLRVDISGKGDLISSLQEELEKERDSNKQLVQEKKTIEEQYEKNRVSWEGESEKLANELRSMKEHYELAIEERDKQHEQEKKALNAELEAERQSRQKLLSAQYELQERIDSLQSKPPPKEHRRSLSDASNNSQQETTVEDDYGYGSVRSVESTRPALEAVNWSAGSHNGPTQPVADAGLVLRMRNRISALQSELSRTQKRASDLEERIMNRHSSPPTNPNIDRYKLEELEIENKKLREHLERLRAAGDTMLVSKEVIEQMNVMQKELDRRRDECIQLKSVLTNQTVNLKSLATSNYGSDVDIINEDGELATAYEAQKGINRQLQEELIAEKKFYSEHISRSKSEIEKLREDNEKYQKLLSADLSAEPKNKTQEFAQNEIIRLAAESLALQERVDKLSESCRRYKNQIRMLVNKLKEVGVDDVNDILDSNDTTAQPNASMTLEMAAVTRKKEREYLGMFEYKIQDEGLIIKRLISDLKPKTAVTLLPGLPAYILFMMLRHMDHVDDEPKMHQLMKAVRTAVKKTLKKRAESVEYNALWLANMLRLLNNLRQYSGDTIYQSANTPRQNQQCLRIFDLSEYRQVLSDIAVWIYQGKILYTVARRHNLPVRQHAASEPAVSADLRPVGVPAGAQVRYYTQWRGDTIYQSANTPRQNQQCLRIFDLSEYRQVLSDIAVWIYQGKILYTVARRHNLPVRQHAASEPAVSADLRPVGVPAGAQVRYYTQWRGDTIYQSANTPRQNQQCLRIFDLSEYRQVLSDIAVWIYQGKILYTVARRHNLPVRQHAASEPAVSADLRPVGVPAGAQVRYYTQWRGDTIYQSANTPRQNQQCLRIFDLSEYRQVLSDIAVWIYQGKILYTVARRHNLPVRQHAASEPAVSADLRPVGVPAGAQVRYYTQWRGDTIYQSANTPRQNQQCLRIFDLSEYRQVLSDIAVWIYQGKILYTVARRHNLPVRQHAASEPAVSADLRPVGVPAGAQVRYYTQWRGDTIYQSANTPRQNQQCLRIFDLSEYRQVLSDIAVWIYQGLIHLLERQLERLIVPAILEHEEISGLSGPAARPRSAGTGAPSAGAGAPGAGAGPHKLKLELTATHDHLHTFAVDQPLRVMIFKQLFYYICAYSLNQLLLRKDLCCWDKGLQIRYNLSHLETWIKEHLAEYGQKSVEEILSVLQPITQAVQLLQARKSMQDVQSTVDMCPNLNAMQVCKILNMYTPAEEYEVKVTREFIHETQKKMQEKAGTNPDKEQQNLLMDSKMIFSVQFPFNPSSIRLEAVEIPEVLELEGLLTKI
ncbi:hypothetical protein PYW07_011819 [Mythimna separata]|uniref:Unconventional myosin-Va n=1 Tax=Mythimna separata TaxID=271217 RepID=A0AAD7Y6W2_MYTSE|nr:hypothetical protein PYW07_011819 [Mythimna separata]